MKDTTIRDFAETWRSGSGGRFCSAVWELGRGRLIRRLIEQFGHLPIAAVRPGMLWEIQQLTLRDGCSPATVNRITAAMMALFRDAEAEGLLEPDTHYLLQRRVKYMRAPAPKRFGAWTESQRDLILDLFREHQPYWFPFVAFLMFTGCRVSEAVAVEWRDVHLEQRRVEIRRSWANGRAGNCKTRRSIRTAKMPRQLVDVLEIVAPAAPTGIVFTGPRGGRIHSQNFNARIWYPTIRLGAPTLPQQPPRCSRHTFTSLALDVLPTADVARQTGDRIEQLERSYHQFTREFALMDIDGAVGDGQAA